MITNSQKITAIVGLVLGTFILWVVLVSIGVNSLFVPTPRAVWTTLINMGQGGLLQHVGTTSLRVFAAVTLSFTAALPVAILMYWNARVRLILSIIVDFIRYLPIPALIPLLILFFGIGEGIKIIILFIGTFFQVVIIVCDQLRNIHQEYYELAYVFHFTSLQKWRMQIRAILPELWDTLRISIGWCWTYIIIAELVATDAGIGRVIKEAQRFSDSSKLYVAIILIGMVGLTIDQGMKYVAPKLFPYRKFTK